jgi:hypothetical protein
MIGCARSCLARVLVLVLLVGSAAAVWWWNPDLVDRLRGMAEPERGPVPSPDVATATVSRYEAFLRAGSGSELRLGGAELTSLVRYAFMDVLPPAVQDPAVELRDGRVHLSGRVALSTLPEIPALREVMGLLPDTVRLELRGTLTPFGDSRAAFHVDRLEASRVPIPSRYIPEILLAMGRGSVPGLPEDALVVPLPPGLGTAFVLRDSLVLVAQP